MATRVRLAEVTADNWEAVADLELADDQKRFVATNVYSIAESKFDTSAQPRAIYAGRRIVGFLMYDLVVAEGPPRKAVIYRFMIDKAHQRKGYGRAALEKAIEEIRRIPGIRKITISYMRDNPAAKAFYASVGFVEAGRDGDREMIAELTL